MFETLKAQQAGIDNFFLYEHLFLQHKQCWKPQIEIKNFINNEKLRSFRGLKDVQATFETLTQMVEVSF